MSSPVRRSVRKRGWLALAGSLVLHGALVSTLNLIPGRTLPRSTRDDGPVAVAAVAEESADEPHTFLVPHPAPDTVSPVQAAKSAAGQEAGSEIAAKPASENVVPVAYQSTDQSVTHSVDQALFASVGGSGATLGRRLAGNDIGSTGCFAVGRPARRVVYVIDRSASMGLGGLLTAATRELHAALERLPVTTHFQVILYHDQAEALLRGPTELLPATTENVQRATQLLGEMRAEGGTNHLQALRLALSMAPEVIYLLTDADDLSDADRREVTRINLRTRAVIHTIELNLANRNRTNMPLQVLARDNRGRYQAVNPHR